MICGNCKAVHAEVATVRACYAGQVHPCQWLVERWIPADPDGYNEGHLDISPCGAPAITDDRGFHCEAGHDHVDAQVRDAEGWDYASDEGEARLRAGYGHVSVLPDGHVYLG